MCLRNPQEADQEKGHHKESTKGHTHPAENLEASIKIATDKAIEEKIGTEMIATVDETRMRKMTIEVVATTTVVSEMMTQDDLLLMIIGANLTMKINTEDPSAVDTMMITEGGMSAITKTAAIEEKIGMAEIGMKTIVLAVEMKGIAKAVITVAQIVAEATHAARSNQVDSKVAPNNSRGMKE